ncbi:hypothetical protein [Gordonia malaquae]|uniref:hypothetical protein n=1 Tax=Gordonia malaquae TaxID=410332 RepID=UPI00301B5BFF
MTVAMIGIAVFGLILCVWAATSAANRRFAAVYLMLAAAHGAILAILLLASPKNGGQTGASQIGRFVSTHSALSWIVAGVIVAVVLAMIARTLGGRATGGQALDMFEADDLQ